MTEQITCNFARCAIHHFTTKYEGRFHKLPKGLYAKILHDYNQQFADTPALKTTYTVASKNSKQSLILHDYNQQFADTPALKTTYTVASKNSKQSLKSLAKSGTQIRRNKSFLILFAQDSGKALIHRGNPNTLYDIALCVKRSMNHSANHSLCIGGRKHRLHHRYLSVLMI